MSFNYNSIWISKAKDELYEAGRNGEGYVFDQDPSEYGAFVRDQNLKQTNLFINQLLGEFKTEKNTVNVALGYNRVDADEPNRIRNEVNMPNAGNSLDSVQFAHVGDYQQRKTYQTISDNEFNGFLKDQYRLIDEDDKMLSLNGGLNFRNKTRDFESQFVGLKAKGQKVNSIDNLDEALLDESRYGSSRDEISVSEGVPDTYNGVLKVYGAFGSVDFSKSAFSGNIGLRYEYDNIDVKWDVGNYVGRTDDVSYDYQNLLPTLNLKYSISEKNLIRLAASKTITLPEFKELAPFEYVSPTGRVTKGNPELQSSTDYNFDLKWEMYMRPKELLSVSAFGKIINDPINLTMKHGAAGNFYYANTGKQANVYGIELEGRFNIINATSEDEPGLRMSFNLTKMWFNQDLLEKHQYNNKTETGLQGAADLIANGSLIFSDNKENEFLATLSANYSSDKIFALGAPEDYTYSDTYFNNEIIEKGFTTVDLVLVKKFSKR
ncbi:MAG: TonB-dependent receptor, partial [Bacteroidales bacterium]|nr:TonB-dependent receptor [Bacteroidales bacterium]